MRNNVDLTSCVGDFRASGVTFGPYHVQGRRGHENEVAGVNLRTRCEYNPRPWPHLHD